MEWKRELKIFLIIAAVFLVFFLIPLEELNISEALTEAVYLTQWYAREHVILCLLPAFFIAGAIGVFISQNSVMKYLGAKANKFLAFGVASVSGGILAVCSCTVLPIFAGIYKRGAGLGPATTFLYSGPAINVLAVILTLNVLGFELGMARAVGAVVFSVFIGVAMQFIFRKEEAGNPVDVVYENNGNERPLWKTAVFFLAMVGVLLFSNWADSGNALGIWQLIFSVKWYLTSAFGLLIILILYLWINIPLKKIIAVTIPVALVSIIFNHEPVYGFFAGIMALSYLTATGSDESKEWFESSWDFTKQIMPLLFYGILIAGFALGRPGHEGIIPPEWINGSVGNNSVLSNLFASLVGALMYFATLTEIPILQGLIGNGMAKGPALALLLAGPALSLPNMLVIKSVVGWKKTMAYVALVVVMSTICGVIYGNIF
jgi:uncharacterized membrane protein YraQ (UPF0718 family)